MIFILATTKTADKINFIYHELSALCRKINNEVLHIDYEIRNDVYEFAVVKFLDKRKVDVEISGLNLKQLTQRILEEI